MKGYRFYLEYKDEKSKNRATVKNPGDHEGNVIAICLDEDDRPIGTIESYPGGKREFIYEGFCAIFFHPNSDVNFGGIGQRHLRFCCKRIPERLAREIHPKLFDRLDN